MGPSPKTLLVTLAVVVAVLAALPLGKGAGHGGEEVGEGAAPGKDANAGAWPCCDNCGRCYMSLCGCRDMSPGGCHPECKHCVHSATTTGGVLLFQCEDIIKNFCGRRCTPAQSK